MLNKPASKAIPIKSNATRAVPEKVVKTEQEGSVFSEFAKVLDFLGIENEYVPINETTKMEQLLVKLTGIDKSVEPVVLEIVFLNDMFKIANEQKDEDDYIDEDDEPSEIVQIFTKLPIKITEANLPGISALILRFNTYIAVGGFGLTEENEVYFRYCLMSETRQINTLLLTEVFDMITFFINVFGKEIKFYSTSEKTLEVALKSGLQSLVNINTGNS